MKRVLVAVVVLALLGLHPAADGQKFTAWSAPVNLGKVVNSSYAEAGTCISRDGRSLYFGSTRPGGIGPTNTFDIWVSHRESLDRPWGAPVNVGRMVNTADNEQTPMLTIDGHRLYFARDGSGGYGSQDIYVSRRQHQWEDTGWREPTNLGSGVNTTSEESGPSIIEDDKTGVLTLYFSSTRDTGMGGEDIYVSTAYPGEPFGSAVIEPLLSGPYRDVRPFVQREGLEVVLRLESPGLVRDQRGPLDVEARKPLGALVRPGEAAGCPQQRRRRCTAGPLVRRDRTLLPFESIGDAGRQRHLGLHPRQDHGARQEIALRAFWNEFGSFSPCVFALGGPPLRWPSSCRDVEARRWRARSTAVRSAGSAPPGGRGLGTGFA